MSTEYVSRTLDLLKVERDAEIEETNKLLAALSEEELEERGIILRKLRTENIHTGLFGRTLVKLVSLPRRRARKLNETATNVEETTADRIPLPAHRFQPGDTVSILPVGTSLAAACNAGENGVVYKITATSITVALHEPPELDLTEGAITLVQVSNDINYKRLCAALERLRTNDEQYRCSEHLRNVCFGLAAPSFSPISPPPSNASFLSSYHRLNESQQQAIDFALSARDIALIHGPPGTGKTTTVAELIVQAVRRGGGRVLAVAPSNIAIDNLLEKLIAIDPGLRLVRIGHPARLLPSVANRALDVLVKHTDASYLAADICREMDKLQREMSKTRRTSEERRALRAQMRELRRELKARESRAVGDIVDHADVVLATTTGADDRHLRGKSGFDLVVVDEAAQALEPACWVAMLRGRRAVLAGDHRQLPPTVKSAVAAAGGLATTLFDRLATQFGEAVMRMLTVQYRMHDVIMTWCSEAMYGGKLQSAREVSGHLLAGLPGVQENPDTTTPLVLIDTAGCDGTHETGGAADGLLGDGSKANEGEARVVVRHVEQLITAGVRPIDIGVLTPYNAQADLLRAAIEGNPAWAAVEVGTVDGFQGREKEAIVLSLVRSNPNREVGFLADDRRINVAVTRARRHCAIVADSDTVSTHPFLKRLVEYCQERGEHWSAMQYLDPGRYGVDVDMGRRVTAAPSAKPPTAEEKRPKKKKKRRPPTSESTSTTPTASIGRERNDEEQVDALKKELEIFMQNTEETEKSFPCSLTSFQRMKVHELAEAMGLVHASQGEGDKRKVIVRKRVLHNAALPIAVSTSASLPQSEEENATEDHEPEETTEMFEVVQPTVPMTHGKKKKKKPKAPSKPKQAEPPPKSKEEEEEELLRMAISETKQCNFAKCGQSLGLLGRDCPFCKKRFCWSHIMAEVHGCGEAAKQHAREKWLRENTVAAKTSKPLNADKRKFLEQQLHKKLDGHAEKRAPQRKKK